MSRPLATVLQQYNQPTLQKKSQPRYWISKLSVYFEGSGTSLEGAVQAGGWSSNCQTLAPLPDVLHCRVVYRLPFTVSILGEQDFSASQE